MASSNISLLKVLERTIANRFPIPRKKTIASSTTDRPAKTFTARYPKEQRMIDVVYFPQLINESVDLVGPIANKYDFGETDPNDASFESLISPTHSPSFCSPKLCSENDTREYVNAVLTRPALAAMHIIASNGVPSMFNCMEANTDCYVTSGFRKDSTGPIADNVLVKGPFKRPEDSVVALPEKEYYYGDDGDFLEEEDNFEVEVKPVVLDGPEEGGPFVLLTIEVKSSNALTPTTSQELMKLAGERGFKDSIVIPFIWPNGDSIQIEKLTKLFAQIFEQMVYYGVEYGRLTSFNENVFFYMKKDTRVLYMSHQYDLNSMTPLHVFAWVFRAKGLIRKGMVVPEPDYTYINAVDPRRTGLMVDPVRAAIRPANPPRYNELRPETTRRLVVPRKKTPHTPTTPKARRIRNFRSEDAPSGDMDVSDDDDTPTPRKKTQRPETPPKPAKPKNKRSRNLKRNVASSKNSCDNDESSPIPKPKKQRKK